LSRVTNRRTVSFVISDFYAGDYRKPLSIANKRHDIVAVSITDPRETELPALGIIRLEDAETGKGFLVDTSSQTVRKDYRVNSQRIFDDRKRLLQSINVDHINVRTDMSYAKELYKFFRMRERRI
ncbi:MAG: DUF58 domain-containing protein, partial [Thermodesulfovibrionia bacterium]|nr:DUF58 domain-containing protein [Thermodesulfovibrionia bacterium]